VTITMIIVSIGLVKGAGGGAIVKGPGLTAVVKGAGGTGQI